MGCLSGAADADQAADGVGDGRRDRADGELAGAAVDGAATGEQRDAGADGEQRDPAEPNRQAEVQPARAE